MKQIPLTQGKFAVVDDEDFEWLSRWKWCYWDGYAVRHHSRPNNKLIFMHREIMKTKNEMETDHINHDGLDNRKTNLRNCFHSQNMKNQKIHCNNKSGFKGVSLYKPTNKWRARITINHLLKFLGYFSTPEMAAHAYDSAAVIYFGQFAKLNFPEQGLA